MISVKIHQDTKSFTVAFCFHKNGPDLLLAVFKKFLTVCVSEGISTQSLREPAHLAQSQVTDLQASSAPIHSSRRRTASSGMHSQGKAQII